MPAGHMTDLMPQHARDLSFVAELLQQPPADEYPTARQCERVDDIRIKNREPPLDVCVGRLGVPGEPLTNPIDVAPQL